MGIEVDALKSLFTVFVGVRKKPVFVSDQAQNPSQGWWPWLILQRGRPLKQAFSSP
jgi:hypothetical protein